MSTPATGNWPSPAAGQSPDGQPEVLFTFDDGPHNQYSAQVLEHLDKHRVQALFFWVGHRALRKKRRSTHSIINRAVRAGHIVGTHTINHVHLCQLPEPLGGREIDRAITLFTELTGLPMTLFRAPYGDYCQRLKNLLAARGLTHFHWDIDSREWLDHDSERVASYIIRKLKYLKGRAVVLMHDTKKATALALPKILTWIQRENQRRRQRPTGREPIRIVDASDILKEHIPLQLRNWLDNLTRTLTHSASQHISQLVPGYPGPKLSAQTH